MVSHKDEDLEAMRKLIADGQSFGFVTRVDYPSSSSLAGKVKPVVDSVHAFDDAINAYDRITSMRATGKVVVKVDPRAE